MQPFASQPTRPRLAAACLIALFAACPVLMATAQQDTAPDEQAPPDTRLLITVTLPTGLNTFDDAALVAVLFEYDPRLADAGAREVDRLVIRQLGHQQGVEQTLRFHLGDRLPEVRAVRRYYVSCRIYEDPGGEPFEQGRQLHDCHNEHDRLPGTVYDEANGRTPAFIAR